jgi:hypothetical protein
MICGFFRPKNWCFGYCEGKKEYIHTPIKNCAVGHNSSYALTDGKGNILRHWKKAIEWSCIRYNTIVKFYAELEDKSK